MQAAMTNQSVQARLRRFLGDRSASSQALYDERLQKAHHIHVPGDDNFRILQHYYGNSRHSVEGSLIDA